MPLTTSGYERKYDAGGRPFGLRRPGSRKLVIVWPTKTAGRWSRQPPVEVVVDVQAVWKFSNVLMAYQEQHGELPEWRPTGGDSWDELLTQLWPFADAKATVEALRNAASWLEAAMSTASRSQAGKAYKMAKMADDVRHLADSLE